MNTPIIEEFIEKVNAKIDALRERHAHCWLCGTTTNNWGVILPDGSVDALGFGSRGDGTARLVFFPICKCHNIDDEANIFAIRMKLSTRRMEMLN